MGEDNKNVELISSSIDRLAVAITEIGFGNFETRGPIWSLGNDIGMAAGMIADSITDLAEAVRGQHQCQAGGDEDFKPRIVKGRFTSHGDEPGGCEHR